MWVLILLAIFAIVLVALALGNMFRGSDRQDVRRPLPTPPEPPRPPQPRPVPGIEPRTPDESSTSEGSRSISSPTDRIPTSAPDRSPAPSPGQPRPSTFNDNSTPSVPRQPLPSPFAENRPTPGQNFPLPTPTPTEIPLPIPEPTIEEVPPTPVVPSPIPEPPIQETPSIPQPVIPSPEPEPVAPVEETPSIREPIVPAADTEPTVEETPSTLDPIAPIPEPEPVASVEETPSTPEADRTPVSPSFPRSDFSDLASDMGVDYTKLRDLLAAQNYKEADGETRHLMVNVIRAMERDYDGNQTFEQFPCTDLRTIDRLWVQYSEGRFGLSVQKPIYDDVGQSYEALGDRVGWRKDGKWLNYHELAFDAQAPSGHLPRVLWVKVYGYCGWEPSSLARRLASCNF